MYKRTQNEYMFLMPININKIIFIKTFKNYTLNR